uniref:Uncharacterized protein n=1 Tax=Rhizophora mucronata TaxID=61149 RepID=A0A2P2NAL1_RHIMU
MNFKLLWLLVSQQHNKRMLLTKWMPQGAKKYL